MKQEEVRHFYAGVTGKLLTSIRDAAEELVSVHAGKGLHLHANDLAANGTVLSSGAIIVTRSMADDSFMWTLDLGFENWTEFDHCIDWNAPVGQFPRMQVPIKLKWNGHDQWGAPRVADVPVSPIFLSRDRISWLGKTWTDGAQVDTGWIMRALLDCWLLEDSPESAQQRALRAVPGGRWERVRQLRAWGPNEVWEVRDLTDSTQPRRVMKLLRFRKGPGTTAHRRLVQEIEITRNLGTKHAGIVPVLDFGIPKDGDEWTPFYVMPLAESTLAKAKDFKENLEGVLRLAVALADALAAAHERGVVHRDVKPDNILLLGEDRRPVVADFGICFLATEEGDRLTAMDAGTVGPANYVAPELLGGRADVTEIDGRADVYSLGKTLYYSYSGGDIFPREYFAEESYDLRKRFDDPRVEHFYGMLERMVVEKREGRFSSMLECREALERALENIKRGNPYEAGMYGRVPTPPEIMDRLERNLRGSTGAARSDMLRDALDDAQSALDVSAAALDDSKPLAGAQELMMQAAFKGGERLLAVGLPLLGADDADGFGRWLERLVGSFQATDERGRHRPRSVVCAAAALALHGAAITAMHKERFDLLRQILDCYLQHRHWFVHLGMFSDNATRSWQWVEGCLPESAIIARFDPRVVPQIGTLLTHVVGLSILRLLLALDAQELAKVIPPREGDLSLDALPGLFPEGCEWVESLPEALLAAPSRERAIAERIFNIAPEALRRECKRITPNLARALRWMASQLRRTSSWIGGVPRGGRWTKWCGGEP